MKPSMRFRDAIKMALAIVIAYAIALSAGWGTPFWAGFAVVFCGLTAVGDSLNKGLLRVFGTLFGAAVALALLGMFPQERWMFLIAMSLFVAFCTYMMGSTTRWYFWLMAGITVPIVAITTEPNAMYDFNRAVMRSQQTTLGIVVYSLVSVLLWPVSSRSVFEGAVAKSIASQRQLFSLYMTQLMGGSSDPSREDPAEPTAAQLRAEVTGTLGGLPMQLDHAELDTYEIWEVRRAWRSCVAQLGALNNTLEAWRQVFDELETVDSRRVIPSLPAVAAELDARLAAIEGLLGGDDADYHPADIACEVDQARLAELPHFEQSAVLLAVAQLQRIAQETRALFDTARTIRGITPTPASKPVAGVPATRAPLDPDRLTGVLRQTTVLWLSLLLAIYVPDLPFASAIIIVGQVLAMILFLHPQLPASVLFWPMAFGTLVGGIAHIGVMPHLSGFLELGTMLFVTVFGIVYLLYSPRNILLRFCGLAFFMVIVSVDTPQHYSFLGVANLMLVFPIILGLLALTQYFPVSLRAEHRFQAILHRFFRSCEFLMSATGWRRDRAPSRLQRWQRAYHFSVVVSAPQKLSGWAHALPAAALGSSSPQQVGDLVTSLQALSDRMRMLMDARSAAQSEAIVRELRDEIHSWRVSVQNIFEHLSANPEAEQMAGLRSRLDAKLERLEARVETLLDQATDGGISADEGENIYLLLGAHRGVSEALVNFVTQSATIDWARLREARF